MLRPRRQFNYFTSSLSTGYKSNRDTRREILLAVAACAAATALSAATTAAATPAISAAAGAARTTGAGARLVDLNPSPLQVGVIERLDCLGRLGRISHLDETEPARLA